MKPLHKFKLAAGFTAALAFTGVVAANDMPASDQPHEAPSIQSEGHIAIASLGGLSGHFAAKAHPANSLVEEAATGMVEALKNEKGRLRNDPDYIYELLDNHLLRHVEFDAVSRLVLGRYWRQTTEEQRERFSEALTNIATALYVKSLQSFDNEKINVLPRTYTSSDGDRAMVQTKIEQDKGNDISVDYKLFLNKNNEWKIYDVIIEGISLVQTYRDQIGYEVEKRGVEGMIRDLESEPAHKAAKAREAKKSAALGPERPAPAATKRQSLQIG